MTKLFGRIVGAHQGLNPWNVTTLGTHMSEKAATIAAVGEWTLTTSGFHSWSAWRSFTAKEGIDPGQRYLLRGMRNRVCT